MNKKIVPELNVTHQVISPRNRDLYIHEKVYFREYAFAQAELR